MTTLRNISLILVLLLPLAAVAKDPEPTAQRLFHIERNKNANIVVYDVQVLPDSNLAKKDPMVVYWLKNAEGGERKGLKWIEKKKAYGFKVKSREGNRLEVDLVADIHRDLVVDVHEGTYRAFIDISGRQALLEKIYIFAEDSGVMPDVKYLELFGTDLETGEEAYEKFIPE